MKLQLEAILGQSVKRLAALSGGCVGEVYRVWLENGDSVVAKVDQRRNAALDTEGFMLQYLHDHSSLPVPTVIYSSPNVLVMEYIEGGSTFPTAAERHAAELLAALHTVTADQFGLEQDTLIGGLHQPNPWTASWIEFFRDQRLLFMGKEALKSGQLPRTVFSRLEKFAERLDEWIEEPDHPSLIHGDVWTTNVLSHQGRITGFIDPAIYYGHPEIELAFTTLFHTFGQAFFARYQELKPIKPGFSEIRRDLYNLYPLLVHVRLFGGGYVGSVSGILSRIGF